MTMARDEEEAHRRRGKRSTKRQENMGNKKTLKKRL